jgi:hypothetical protein
MSSWQVSGSRIGSISWTRNPHMFYGIPDAGHANLKTHALAQNMTFVFWNTRVTALENDSLSSPFHDLYIPPFSL